MVDVSEKVLAKAKKWLIDRSVTWTTNVTRGNAWDLDGNCIGGENYTACHAWVANTFRKYVWKDGVSNYTYAGGSYKYTAVPYKKDAKNFLVLSCHSKVRSKGICTPEAHEAIILWLASDECPLSKFIVNRDDKESLVNGGVVILCGPDGATEPQALWICKVLRYGVEGGQALDVWHTLHKGGVNGLLAVLVASYVRTVKGAAFGYTGVESHSTVFSGYYRESPVNPAALLNPKFNPDAGSTTGVFLMPPLDGKAPAKPKAGINEEHLPFKGFCKPVKKSDGWGGEIEGQGADASEFVKQVLAWEHELRGLVPPDEPEPELLLPNENTVFLDLDM